MAAPLHMGKTAMAAPPAANAWRQRRVAVQGQRVAGRIPRCLDGGACPAFLRGGDLRPSRALRIGAGARGRVGAVLTRAAAGETFPERDSTPPGGGECTTSGGGIAGRIRGVWDAGVRKVFRLEDDQPLWEVPWHYQTIGKVMVLWFMAFWLVGSWGMPLAAQFIGCDRATLSYRGQAFYSLLTDISEMTVGLTILWRCLARYMPLSGEWFPIKLRGGWPKDVLLACSVFPLVNLLSQINQDLLPIPGDAWPAGSPLELSLSSRDPVANLLYVAVVSVCAPIWEEVIFRGFLLPSLSRYMPITGSVVVSAIAFALAHFSMQRLLPLFFLGVVMGVVFVRSRNLLASMLLHSLWNGFVFLQLLH